MSSGQLHKLLSLRQYPVGGDYPLGVVAAGADAQTAWDTQTTAGLSGATLYTPAANPSTITANGGAISGSDVNYTSGTRVVDDVDFTGYHVNVDGAADVTFRNCKFANSTDSYSVLLINVNSGTTAIVRPEDCYFDLTNMTKTFSSGIRQFGGSLFGKRCKLINAALNFHDLASNSVTGQWEDSYFKDFGTDAVDTGDPGTRDHCESLKVNVGSLIMTRCFIDIRTGSIAPNTCTSSGPFPEADSTDVVLTMTSCVIAGTSNTGATYTFQHGSGDSDTTTVTLNNCAMDTGTGGFYSKGANGVLNGDNNFNLTTGAELSLPYN